MIITEKRFKKRRKKHPGSERREDFARKTKIWNEFLPWSPPSNLILPVWRVNGFLVSLRESFASLTDPSSDRVGIDDILLGEVNRGNVVVHALGNDLVPLFWGEVLSVGALAGRGIPDKMFLGKQNKMWGKINQMMKVHGMLASRVDCVQHEYSK